MTVRFVIPGPLTPLTAGRSAVDVQTSATTLRDALQTLFTAYPGLRDRIATEQGELRQHVNVFVGKEDSRFTGGLATPVRDGAEISIIPAITGGR
jgi:sulfur-carrier protein